MNKKTAGRSMSAEMQSHGELATVLFRKQSCNGSWIERDGNRQAPQEKSLAHARLFSSERVAGYGYAVFCGVLSIYNSALLRYSTRHF